MKTKLFGSVSAAAVFAVLQTGAAFAADAADSSGGSSDKIEQVTVTAQRRAEDIQKTPVAVTALSGTELEARQLVKVENLAAAVPSLQIQQVSAEPSALVVDMRGDAELGGGLVTSESPVAMYVDDVYQSRLSIANMDLGDITQVEVLRGPQGTLYGRNSMTGAMKFITRQPDGSTWFETSLGYGSYDERRVQFTAGAPVADHIAFALAGLYDDKDGWMYDTALDRHVGGYATVGLRGSIGLVDMGPLTAVLRFSYSGDYGEGQYLTPVNPVTFQPLVPFGETRSPIVSSSHPKQSTVSLTLGYEFSPALTVRSISALETTIDEWGLDFSGGLVAPPVNSPVAGFFRYNTANAHEVTEEVQALGDLLDGRLHYIGGLFYFNENAGENIQDTVGAGGFGFGFPATEMTLLPTLFNTQSRSIAAYFQTDYKLTPKLTVTTGIRYSADTKNFSGVIQSGLFTPTYAPVTSSLGNGQWTPKLTAQYQFDDSNMGYITIARGYRAGGFNGLAVVSPPVFGSPYRPESDWSYEIGDKLQFWDDRAQLNSAFYYEQLYNLQLTSEIAGGNFPIQNAAQAHVYGLELEGTVIPVDGVNLYGMLTLTNDGYDSLSPLTAAAQAGATELPLISKIQGQIGGSWSVQPAWMQGAGLTLRADYDFRSNRWVDPTQNGAGYIPPATYINASAELLSPDSHWQLSVAGHNLADKHYYFSGLSFIEGQEAAKFPSLPRTWMLTLKYSY